MRYRRGDIVERAVLVLDQFGLADLSMRRLAAELGLQPSALYHHVASKQELLAAALQSFYQMRDVPGIKKKPSTSEFLDWLKLLMAEDIPAEALHSQDNKAVVPPLHGALLKNEQDVHLFERLISMSRMNR